MDLTPAIPGKRDRGRYAIAALAALLMGGVAGAGLLEIGPVKTLALLSIAAFGVAFLRSVWVSFAAVVAIVCLLPYAVLPVSTPAGTPALIELASFASIVIVAAVVLCDRRLGIPLGVSQALWLGLIGVAGFAFLLGVGRGYTPQTFHDFVKFLLALGGFALVIVLVRRFRDAVLVMRMLMVGTVAAAGLALLLYTGGPGITERALVRLVPYGYPGSRIVRYIEDDPARPMRAVGTGVDPNSLGGLMMVGFVLGAGQLFGRNPAVSRWLSGPAVALCGMAMMLTYSRGAWVGAAAGLGVILIMRRRAWLPVLGGLGAAAVALGAGSGFVDRLWQGFTLQDPATRLRLQEYQNALEIIRRHPMFGIGFGEAGSLDLQEGVSSIYLTIAQQAGLVGLAVFLVAVGAILWAGTREVFVSGSGVYSDLLLTAVAALAAMLTVGLVDHYFFNIRFPHMAALFWIVGGLIVALTRMRQRDDATKGGAYTDWKGQTIGEDS